MFFFVFSGKHKVFLQRHLQKVPVNKSTIGLVLDTGIFEQNYWCIC